MKPNKGVPDLGHDGRLKLLLWFSRHMSPWLPVDGTPSRVSQVPVFPQPAEQHQGHLRCSINIYWATLRKSVAF